MGKARITPEMIQQAKHKAKIGINRMGQGETARVAGSSQAANKASGVGASKPKAEGIARIRATSAPQLPRVSRPGASLSQRIKDTSAAITNQYRAKTRGR